MIVIPLARVLTNLAAADENHGLIVPQVFILLEVLRASELPIKVHFHSMLYHSTL